MISVRDSGILTVRDQPGFVDTGRMIEVSLPEWRIDLTLNLEAIARSHLTASSNLLRLHRRTSEKLHFENP
jgi:hypothetical protein